MRTVTLELPPDQARVLTKAAFEQAPVIEEYWQEGNEIVGEGSEGLFKAGARVRARLETPLGVDDTTTVRIVASERRPLQIGSSAETFERAVTDRLRDLQSQGFESVYEETNRITRRSGSKETAPTDTSQLMYYYVILALIAALGLSYIFAMISAG